MSRDLMQYAAHSTHTTHSTVHSKQRTTTNNTQHNGTISYCCASHKYSIAFFCSTIFVILTGGYKTVTGKFFGQKHECPGKHKYSIIHKINSSATGTSWNPKGGQGAGRGAARRGAGISSQRDQKRSATGTDSTSKPSSAGTMSETKTCRGCFVKGLLNRNCPNNPDRADSKIIIATEADGDADDDVYDTAVYLLGYAVQYDDTKNEITTAAKSNSVLQFNSSPYLTIKQAAVVISFFVSSAVS
jgi:hypothetical protein